MSRHGYSEDLDDYWALIRWRGAVTSALRGRRGQALLRELVAALDAMPKKELIAEKLAEAGEVCALGAVGQKRGINMTNIDPEDSEQVSKAFDVAEALAREIVYENDEGGWQETPGERWNRMRAWAVKHLAAFHGEER